MSTRKRYHRLFVFLLVLISLGASVATGVHVHDDGHPHADCSVCVAGSLLSPGSLAAGPSVVTSYVPVSGQEPQETGSNVLIIHSVVSSRAPPLS